VRCGWQAAPPHLQNFTFEQNHSPLKPPVQPGRSTQCRLHHPCFTLQRLHLILQQPMACPGLTTHILAGPCALWLASGASTPAAKLKHSAKPQHPQTTCPAQPQHPVEVPAQLLHTAEAAFDLAVAHGMLRSGHSQTGRALCAMVGEQHLQSCSKTQAFSKTAVPSNHLLSPAAAPSAGSRRSAAHFRGCI